MGHVWFCLEPPVGVFCRGCCSGLFLRSGGALLAEFLVHPVEFSLNFFGFRLNLCFDEITEDFRVNGRFDVNYHGSLLGGGSVEVFFSLWAMARSLVMA